MLSKEQIEEYRRELIDSSTDEHHDAFNELCDLALKSLQPEEARGGVFISLDMLKFLHDLSKVGAVPINAITDRCHSSLSNHYRGRAVDFACNVNISKANAIAAQHGGAHNFENCANNAHWHFDF